MKISILICLFLLFGLKVIYGQNIVPIKAGSLVVDFEYIDNNCDTLVFVNLHNNEKTSIQAIKQVLTTKHGRFLGLQSNGKREHTIIINERSVSFDPNRIYTNVGVEKTLKNYDCFSDSNCTSVYSIGKEILTLLSKAKLIVAVHNNTGEGYSITGILKTNPEKHDATEIFINPKRDENDFYLVTEKAKFDYFKAKGYNVVLQDNIKVDDDGSLSVYCGKSKIDYINVECQNGHLNEQIEMIDEIYKGFFN